MSTDLISSLTAGLKAASSRQYENCWKSWMSFLRDKRPEKIDVVFVLEYLNFLFQSRKLAPSSVSSHRSALREPLRVFGVDFSDDWFSTLSKSQALRRPAVRPPSFSWSVNEVLSYASSISNAASHLQLLDKALFLITLALRASTCFGGSCSP